MTRNAQPAVMAGNSTGWIRASRERPCPICSGPDNCSTTPDGVWAYCGRISDGSIKENSGGQFLHLLTDDGNGGDLPPEYAEWQERERQRLLEAAASEPEPEAPVTDWAEMADRFYHGAAAQRQRLASELGVSCEALDALGIGWTGEAWSTPERDGDGRIIGLSLRKPDGSKSMATGSKRGLTYCPDWQEDGGPVLAVEGMSDVAAGLTLGFCTIGRPSNVGGVSHLAKLLQGVPRDRQILILGELDARADCRWPGREGAETTATALADLLNRPVDWAIVPDGAKDLREWLNR